MSILTTDTKLAARHLREFFSTVRIYCASGRVARIVSDGCAGDGHTHWRAIYIGKKLVASLEDWRGRFVEVRVAFRGNLRHKRARTVEMANLQSAVEWITESF